MAFPELFEPKVSDHAVVRWLERFHGFDVEAVRGEILGGDRRAWVAQGAWYVRVPALEVSLVAREGKVITILPSAKGK